MRRLTQPDHDDHGVATIFLILAMAALFIGAALAIDVSRYNQETSSAQHSADATVLALAADCVLTGAPIADYSLYRQTAQTINTPACGDGETTIMVTKLVTEGLLLNRDAGSVDRRATARWGTLGRATTVPIVIAKCAFDELPLDEPGPVTILLDNPNPLSGCSSPSGGFSALLNLDGDCSVDVAADGTVPGHNGEGELRKTFDDCLSPLPRDVLIPIYDDSVCGSSCKGSGPYFILGFATFRITGSLINGRPPVGSLTMPRPYRCPDASPEQNACIRGDFIRFTTSQGSPGPSTDFGTVNVYLSS